MRRRSLKRSQQDEADRATLTSFALDHGFCWVCRARTALEIHHIAGRHHPERNARCNLLRACADCHRLWTDNRWLPSGDWRGNAKEYGLLVALAYKHLYDRAYYDRPKLLTLAGKHPEFITTPEVMAEIRDIRRDLWN